MEGIGLGEFVGGDEYWVEWVECVEIFVVVELVVVLFELLVLCGDVVGDGVFEDIG